LIAQNAPPTPHCLAIANQKGGVGKTTTAVNLATALAAAGQQVVLVDFDPQGNASTAMGLGRDDRMPGAYELLTDSATAHTAARDTMVPGLRIIPTGQALAGAEIELVDMPARTTLLRRALASLTNVDWLIIDCPPSIGLLTLNALVAADDVLVPLQTEFLALEGLTQMLATIEQVRARGNPRLDLLGIVLTMYDRRNKLSEAVEADVRAALGNKVLKTVIPRNVRLSEAPSHGMPALLYDMRAPGSEAYMALARELLAGEIKNGDAKT
jgi:chromosome partitioning protein